jgi:hypothetical protein
MRRIPGLFPVSSSFLNVGFLHSIHPGEERAKAVPEDSSFRSHMKSELQEDM